MPRREVKNRSIKRNPPMQERPLSDGGDTAMYHGGLVRRAGPYGDAGSRSGMEAAAHALAASVQRGLLALENATSEFAPDVEAVPGASVEVFDIFDIDTGDHIVIWRVLTRERSANAS